MQLISEKVGQEIGRVPNRIDQEEDPLSIGIDFVDVAESHVLFFGRMKEFIHGESPESEEDTSGFKPCCELDRWMTGIGASRFGHLSSFGRLHEAHVEFHRHAAEVLAKIHAGSWVDAEHMRKRELSQALRRMLIMLTELNESINRQALSMS